MIISRTPFRVSFVGGGSDMREFYREHGGAVLSAGIASYMYLGMRRCFNERQILLKYLQSELVESVNQIQHPIIREVFSSYGIIGVDFHSCADVPAGTGLGSSSSFTVGLINLCNAYTGKSMTTHELAESACRVEIDRLHEPIGKQDQYAAAFGGLNLITFQPDDVTRVERVTMNARVYTHLQRNLKMYFLGHTRAARAVLAEQQKDVRTDRRKIACLKRMVQLAYQLYDELSRNDVSAVGDILHTGWMYKKELARGISNERIEYYYELGLKNGARGGKLLGAGGCGFLLFYVPEGEQDQLRRALPDLQEISVAFDEYGSTIIDLNRQEVSGTHSYARAA
jgi:D-glycero-alpha-D-manno-heptose-7-phosphate kinase